MNRFRGYYCEECGKPTGSVDYGWYPFHSHNNLSVASDPRSPYCSVCGKTVRQGFVPSVTCQCQPETGEEEAHGDRHGS